MKDPAYMKKLYKISDVEVEDKTINLSYFAENSLLETQFEANLLTSSQKKLLRIHRLTE